MLPSLAVYFLFYIFTTLLVPCCSIVCMFIQDENYFIYFYILCVHRATFIHSYILWCFMDHNKNLEWVVMTKWVIVYLSIMCVWDGAKLSPFVRSGKKTILQVNRLPNLSAQSWGAGVTQEKKCLASSGEKNMLLWCNKIPEDYISAIQANP